MDDLKWNDLILFASNVRQHVRVQFKPADWQNIHKSLRCCRLAGSWWLMCLQGWLAIFIIRIRFPYCKTCENEKLNPCCVASNALSFGTGNVSRRFPMIGMQWQFCLSHFVFLSTPKLVDLLAPGTWRTTPKDRFSTNPLKNPQRNFDNDKPNSNFFWPKPMQIVVFIQGKFSPSVGLRHPGS